MKTELTFSRPVTSIDIPNWPIGRQRCVARFAVEETKNGQRVTRQTENKTRTGWNKPKKTTYATRFRIVDGDDGKTYLLAYSREWKSVTVWSGNCQHTIESASGTYDEERYTKLMKVLYPEGETR